MPTQAQNEFFKEGLSEWDESLDRREFLKLSAAALALAGLSACVKPPLEKMVSYVSQPEDLIPGEPSYFATHYVLGGRANGLLVETHEGRPTRIDGNPEHVANLGSASAIHQALALSVYHPDRVRANPGGFKKLKEITQASREKKGAGFAILSEPIFSEVVAHQRAELLRELPLAQWIEYSPLKNGAYEEASRKVLGALYYPVYQIAEAKLIVNIDSDFLSDAHFPLSYAAAYANQNECALFTLESSASLSGQKSQKRLCVKPSRLEYLLTTLAANLLSRQDLPASLTESEKTFFETLLLKIKAHPSATLFIPGEHLSSAVQSICLILNHHFAGKSIQYSSAPFPNSPLGLSGLGRLTEEMRAGKIETLIILGGDPVYTSPAQINFKTALTNVKFSTHLSLDETETSQCVNEMIPKAHPLEAWGDARAFDGTLSFSQPMIAPLYDGLTESELISYLFSQAQLTGRDLLASHFKTEWKGKFDDLFKTALARGFLPESHRVQKQPALKTKFSGLKTEPSKDINSFEICFRADRKVYDGSLTNHPWLQELPDPLTRLTWGNAILMNPADLISMKLETGDIVEISLNAQVLEAPVFADPFQAKQSATVNFGYGRKVAGFAEKIVGFNAYALWDGQAYGRGAQFKKTGRTEEFACTQSHHLMEGKNLIKRVALDEKASVEHEPASLYAKDPIPNASEAWAMTIDLDRCTGCGACVVACQSENNIPTVGKDAVRLGREMHWIRVDRYFDSTENPVAEFQPVPCMHCEKAPCEPVCPTGATVHGSGGLNQMVYNRCVGTRYCSNNCPYKVRRFNFLTYIDKNSKLSARQKNPNVSVRTRGVMEKCTYCTQRISAARIKSGRENRAIRDGEVKTACQVTCPSHAIEFGNLRDTESNISLSKKSHRNYALLGELGTRPRTTYLAKVSRGDT